MGYTFVMLLESQQLNIFSYSCKKDFKKWEDEQEGEEEKK